MGMDAAAQVVDKLASLPSTTDPFLYLSEVLQAQLFPRGSQPTIDGLYFLSALLAMIEVFVIISLVMRWWKKSGWVFRYDPSLKLIKPHGSVSWTLVALLATARNFILAYLFRLEIFSLKRYIVLEVLLFRYIQLLQGHPRADSGYFFFVSWQVKLLGAYPCKIELTRASHRAPVWIAGSVAIWSVGASLVLHLYATGHNVQKAAICLDVLGVTTPCIVVGVALPLTIKGGAAYGDMVRAYRALEENLARQSATWTPGTTFEPVWLLPDLPLFETLSMNLVRLGRYARASYIFYTIATAFLGLALLTVGSYYLVRLRRVLARSTEAVAQSDGHKRVRRSLNSLILFLAAFTLLDVASFVISVLGAVNPLISGDALILVPLWLYACIGVPCAILLIRGAYHADRNDQPESTSDNRRQPKTSRGDNGVGSRSTNIRERGTDSVTVTVVVDVLVDRDDDAEAKEKVPF
ncbi:uncharacterized protein JCM15063_004252 [Sporobolomyces koalae]|uniref:uncharacterized protein n=1 Tax=Sporobolomyces koalae TaxID=500713 RepID=UPI0031821054